MKPDDMGMGLRSCVGVYLLELVRLLQYKWGTIFRQEWFWMMEETTKRNGKGVWTREVETVLKRFDASLEWLMGRIKMRDEEMDKIRRDAGIRESEKKQLLSSMRIQSINDVLVEVETLTDTHFFNEFSETETSLFL